MVFIMCFFKEITGFPCPGCGITRAFMCILYGDLMQALWYNPIAVLLAFGGILLLVYSVIEKYPPWCVQSSIYKLFHRKLSNWVIIVASIATIINWMWNISKGL